MSDSSGETLAGRWQLDPQRSRVEFEARNFWGLVTVKGHFDDYDGRLDLDAEPAIELTIDAASVNTGNARRDRHLRSADFFDAEHHPRLRYVSESTALEGDELKVHGSLVARDRSITLDVTARTRRVGDELEIEAVATAPHRELGMTWNPLGVIPPQSRLRVSGYLVPRTTARGSKVAAAPGMGLASLGVRGAGEASSGCGRGGGARFPGDTYTRGRCW